MKKKFIIILLLAVFLTACGSQNTDKKTKANLETTSTSQTTKKETASSSKKKVEEVEKTEVYQYETEDEGGKQIIKETIIYKGDEFLKMGLHITHKATEEDKAKFAGVDFETVKTELLAYLDQQPSIQQLKAVPGVSVGTAVMPEYDIIMDVQIDMKTVDLQALSAVEGMGADLTQLSELTPAEYILGLKLNGATAVTP
ncbi:SP0191 family lipoprotein [Streptococcus cameli]